MISSRGLLCGATVLGDRRWRAFVPCLIVFVLVLPACRPILDTRGKRHNLDPAAVTSHAMHSEQLRGIMRELDVLGRDRLPQEMDKRSLVEQRLRDLSRTGDVMAIAAPRITDAMANVELSSADRAVFVALADELLEQAVALRDQAGQGNLRESEAAYRRIHATCDKCHDLFRADSPESG